MKDDDVAVPTALPEEPLTSAAINWNDQGQPRSLNYNDIYYSASGGLQETEHVFLAGNDLPGAWANKAQFTIAELGFGTGLNFLVTWKHWLATAAEGARLQYISFEKHPLSKADLLRALSCWPELESLTEQLTDAYPPHIAGFHRLTLGKGVSLTLVFGDALAGSEQLTACVDAWYLDGFTPSKNPDLWSAALLRQVVRLSAPEATYATYSSSPVVRENLTTAGFSLSVTAGFGSKRNMLRGALVADAKHKKPRVRVSAIPRAIVIGAGLAGSMVAQCLAGRGFRVQLFEQEPAPARRASGNSSAIFMPQLSIKPDTTSRFYIASFCFLLRHLASLNASAGTEIGSRCGVLTVPKSARLLRLLKEFSSLGLPESIARVATAAETEQLCGVPLGADAIYFPSAGWLSPVAYCQAVLNECRPAITCCFGSRIGAIQRVGDTWQVRYNEGAIAEADIVVAANAFDCLKFDFASWFPLEEVRGQVLSLRTVQTALKAVVCYDGYIIPESNTEYMIGATYDHHNFEPEVDPGKEQQLMERLRLHIPALDLDDAVRTGARVSFRTNAEDRLPLIGPVPDVDTFEQAFRQVNGGGYGKRLPTSVHIPGLYVSVGHGSRGVVSSALAAEIIASMICEEPLPLEDDLIQAILPGRYLARKFRRGESTAKALA